MLRAIFNSINTYLALRLILVNQLLDSVSIFWIHLGECTNHSLLDEFLGINQMTSNVLYQSSSFIRCKHLNIIHYSHITKENFVLESKLKALLFRTHWKKQKIQSNPVILPLVPSPTSPLANERSRTDFLPCYLPL